MKLSIVIPVFNEAKRIYKTFDALNAYTASYGFSLLEVIFVNDGSTDSTLSKLKEFKKTSKLPITIHSYTQNKGKGNAVRIGMIESTGDFALLCDADMSTPLSELKKLSKYAESNNDVIIGTRKNGRSTVLVHQPKFREFLGKGFTLITKISLNLPVTDFTCGFKLFSRKAVVTIFNESVINGWGYDAEILYIAKKKRLFMVEKAVMWSDDKNTHVNILTAVPKTIYEIGKIISIHSILPKTQFIFSISTSFKQKIERIVSAGL